jgi:hypothetical protein
MDLYRIENIFKVYLILVLNVEQVFRIDTFLIKSFFL